MHAEKFSLELKATLTPENHVGVSSGFGVVQPIPRTVCGVGDCFSPPFAARLLRLAIDFVFDGHRAVDNGNYGKGDCGLLYAGGTWRPDFLLRHGTYHQRIEGRLISFRVESRLAAFSDEAGYFLEVKVKNRCGRTAPVSVEPKVQPGKPKLFPLTMWDYSPPPAGDAAEAAEEGTWDNGAVTIRLLTGAKEAEIADGAEAVFCFAVLLSESGKSFAEPRDWTATLATTSQRWEERIGDVLSRLPLLSSDIPGLEAFYRRSLLSGLVCMWERPDFVTQPFLATSGMDGGAICAYPWDLLGYAPHTTCLLLGDRLPGWIEFFLKADLTQYSRFAPSGQGNNLPYSYNFCSMLLMAVAASAQRGVRRELFDEARRVFEHAEKGLTMRDGLADFGVQHNLLEMRQCGWEHYVASPNAERAWVRDRLAEMADALQIPGGKEWREEAEKIRQAIREQLWNKKTQWFDSIFPDGSREEAWSIQGFDALRFGELGPEIEQGLFQHVRDGVFLAKYGITSVSATDERHYEANDHDWSGAGSYMGEGPNLAQTMWEKGRPDLGWDILKRYFWMGEHLLYYPQEAFCDRPAVPANKRSNIVAGLAGVEAILFGLLGLRLTLDGAVTYHPACPVEGTIEVKGLALHGRKIDLRVEPGRISARVDGKESVGKPGQTLELIAGAKQKG
jgi:hypothetical protein